MLGIEQTDQGVRMVHNLKDTLEQLAKETNPEARSLLIRKVTAEYSRRTGHTPSDMERTLFSALVLDLYDQIDLTVRRDIITLLARTSHISEPLAERLSQEDDALVAGLFEHSPVLSEKVLLTAIRKRNEAVLMSIAKRDEVPVDLVDAMMARAFVNVIGQLLRNDGAEFSSNAMIYCSILGANSLKVRSDLAARCLFDPAFQNRMVQQIDSGCPLMPPSLVKAMKEGTLEQLAGDLEDQVEKLTLAGEDVSREEAMVQLNMGELSFDALLGSLIETQRKEDIIWFLRDRHGLSDKAMEHLLQAEGNRTLTRLLLEHEVSLKTFEALQRWRIDELDYPSRHLYRDIEDYRQNLRHSHALHS